MKHPVLLAGAIVNVFLCALCGAAAQSRSASVLTIWRIPAPLSADPTVQPVEAGTVALNFLAPQLAAIERHPSAKITLAVDPIFVAALEKAASGESALTGIAAGQIGADDPRMTQMLDVLSSDIIAPSDVVHSAVGARFITDASAARLSLLGDKAAHFSQRDDVDFAAGGILVSLAASGNAGDHAALFKKNALTNHDLQVLASAFTRACRDVLEKVKRAAADGTVELAALPAYEPIMPLLINAGGRSRQVPYTVDPGAGADVGYAVEDGLRAARSIAPAQGTYGVLSPAGAYDDEVAVLLQAHHAAYGIFSERVVRANAGASAESVLDVHSAPYRAYLLETSKTSKLPVFFCSDATSNALDTQLPGAPPSAFAERLNSAVNLALATSPQSEPTVVVVCLNGTGTVMRRPDRQQILDDLMALLASAPAIRATTPRDYLRQHPPTAETYGYAPGSDAGGFDSWMGSANQMSLWNALADARKAVGGDVALEKPDVRDALLRAESGMWYFWLAAYQPRYLTDQSLSRFRTLIAEVYRAGGKPVPPNIAPVKLDAPAPVGIPGQ
ncbi:MAG TPA: hypothetical protein VGW96_02920 [Candidatus Eremiobacteraceae bacterium]|nr:hypothetical protein [Candidatus Eremiobacteraceae bacterium]